MVSLAFLMNIPGIQHGWLVVTVFLSFYYSTVPSFLYPIFFITFLWSSVITFSSYLPFYVLLCLLVFICFYFFIFCFSFHFLCSSYDLNFVFHFDIHIYHIPHWSFYLLSFFINLLYTRGFFFYFFFTTPLLLPIFLFPYPIYHLFHLLVYLILYLHISVCFIRISTFPLFN